jgi:nucleoside-diphosphate-sugar epimerase
MASPTPKILLSGATGYIGGTILPTLLASDHPVLRSARISILLRDEDGSRSATLTKAYGNRVIPIPFADQDDLEHVTEIAAQHDIAINTTMGFHPTFGAALVRGLAQRKAHTSLPPFMIHTSGTTNVADRPLTGIANPDREFDDAAGAATYEWETEENQRVPYGQRTAELGVINAGLETGVRTLVIMSPMIYGIGTGLFNQHSMQIPRITRSVLQHGKGFVLGTGAGVWDNVHIADLGELYTLVLVKYLDQDPQVPTGKEGIIFSGSRRHTWREVSQHVADEAYAKGKISSPAIQELSNAQIGDLFGDAARVELGLASNSKTVASVARRLGWQPRHGDESWKRGFGEELEKALESS